MVDDVSVSISGRRGSLAMSLHLKREKTGKRRRYSDYQIPDPILFTSTLKEVFLPDQNGL